MSRFRTFGGLDDVRVDDGDVGYLGMNLRVPPWQLKPGLLSLSENGRIDGSWEPRKGVSILTEDSLAAGTPLRVPFWLVDDVGGVAVSAVERAGGLVTVTAPGHGLPFTSVAASAVVDPAGADNAVKFTAAVSGPAGNGISVSYVESGTSPLVVSVDGNSITVTIGEHTEIEISGELTSNGVNPTSFDRLIYDGEIEVGGELRPSYFSASRDSYVAWLGQLVLRQGESGANVVWISAEGVPSPLDVVTWTPVGAATGVPVLSLEGSSAVSVLVAINTDPIASMMVIASPSGSLTGSVSPIGPVFLQGGSNLSDPAYLTLEGVTTPTVEVNGSWLMTPSSASTLTFSIPGAAGSESYALSSAVVLARIDDFATGNVLGSCVFSDPNSDDEEFAMVAYGNEVKKISFKLRTVESLTLPAGQTLDGAIDMVQAMDRVLIFRDGRVAMEWKSGGSAFTLVPSGIYTQPQIFTANGSGASITNGLVVFTVVGNTTIKVRDLLVIYSATDTRFASVVGNQYEVAAISGTTSISVYMALPNSASGSNAVQIGKNVSVGGGFIFQPGFPWAVYFQRRLWGPYEYKWNTSPPPGAFDARNIHDEIIASDILDSNTFDPIYNQYRLTAGTADRIVALHPFYDDTLLVLNRNSIHAISGTVGSLADTAVNELTREIGCVARRSVVTQGNSIFFLSDNGIYGLAFADQYNLRGLEKPLSESIQPYIDRISGLLAGGVVAAYFNNRYWLAVPLDSEVGAGDAVGNNVILVFNMLNSEWESADTFGDPAFLISNFLIGSPGGMNALFAVTTTGGVHEIDAIDEDYDRIASNNNSRTAEFLILAKMQTRGFMCGTGERKRFAESGVQMKSGTAQSDIGITFSTDDPDNSGTEVFASATTGELLAPSDSADVRARIGGVRGFNGSVLVRRVIGRPTIRGIKVSATAVNRATFTQK